MARWLPLLTLCLVLLAPHPARASDWATRLDAWVQVGQDEPEQGLAGLAALSPADDAAQRGWWLARGQVLVFAGRLAEADELAQRLQAQGQALPVAQGDAALLRALLADGRDDSAAALQQAQAALAVYQQHCPSQPGCDYRSAWLVRALLSRHERRRGVAARSVEHGQAALALAVAAGDGTRQAIALGSLSESLAQQGDTAQAARLLAQAVRLARAEGSLRLQSRLQAHETLQAMRAGDTAAARRAAETGLQLALQSGSERLQATHLLNLSDVALKVHQPQAALKAIEQALPLVRRLGHKRPERTLMHNAALARLALGRVAEARQTLQQLREAYRASGARADEAVALREFADALATVGDLKGALELYHQERALAAEITAANREAALAELRQRFDQESQQRQMEQLGRENSLMAAQLDNRARLQQVWTAGAAAIVLAMVLVALLYQRVRRINRRLAHNHAYLRAQTQRDPLTGLANRRALHEAAQAQGAAAQFGGALLLVDIDHFKHINDGHGHAAGDQVLVEVAGRLSRVVRDGDLVVRWGGEEFLIFMPGVGAAQAHALAARVLQGVGGQPVLLASGAALRVTVSVGHAAFPLPPGRLPLTLERAINLVDMALYSAKGQGRNRAIGISAVRADDDAGLRQVEGDFEQAWHDGRVTLQRTTGPQAPPVAAPAPDATTVSHPA